MRCPACGAESRADARFCEDCGAALAAVVCPACGAPGGAGKKFCGACGAPLPAPTPPTEFAVPRAYTPAHLAARILRERAALVGERKQVTVLFADVSGFTSIAERLDPEHVHALMNHAFELMLAEIHRYEGTVNQFLGDGLMALFGAPVAHEDHAQRAAYAALAMQRALADYRGQLARERGVDFRVRMGLNTGLVVVGAIGDNLRMDYTAVGDTTNIAARMQQLAEPGQIVVAGATERLIAPFVDLISLGSAALKNREGPVATYALRGVRSGVSRLDARTAQGLTPFVGRDDAVAALERAWTEVRGGRGQLALVVGDPGIGKSRLLLEFRRRQGGDATWMEGECISFGQSTPFLPIVALLKRHFGIRDADGEADIRNAVRDGTAFLGDEAATVMPYLCYLLSVDPGDEGVARLDPAQRRARIVAAILRLLAASSRRQPLVLVVEDAHWIDSASQELLISVAEAVPGMAVLLVVTYRPTYQQPFGDRTYHWRIALRPVDEGAAARIVRATLGIDGLPDELEAKIAAKAEGNPFFLEEIGRALVQTGAVRLDDGRLALTRAASTIVVPETVQDVIAARLDRLAEAQKRTVQTAAVIGREFARALLERVGEPPAALDPALAELTRVELIYARGDGRDRQYVFRHALTQDVAYASLLQAERRRLHAAIGAGIEELHGARLDEHAEELVHHFTRGEVWDKVVRYAREAADRAAALCVDDRAVAFAATALEALAHLGDTADNARVGVEVRLAMRAPLWRSGRPDEVVRLLKEAETLAGRHGFTAALDTIYAFFVQYHWARGEHATALEYAARCLDRAAVRDDLGLRITGLYYTLHAYHALGRYHDVLRTAHEIETWLDGPRRLERFGLSGLPLSGSLGMAADACAELGDLGGAQTLLERAKAVARDAEHVYSQLTVAAVEGGLLADHGDAARAIDLLEATAAECRERKFLGQQINALRHLGAAYLRQGRFDEAIRAAREAIALQASANVSVNRGLKLRTVALALAGRGDLAEARATIEEALEYARRQGERAIEARALLARAEIAFAAGDSAAAAEDVDAAGEIAEELALMPLVEQCRAMLRRLRA